MNGNDIVHPLDLPWTNLLLTAVVVPLIAVAVAGIFTRSRLAVERRVTT